MTGIFLGPVLEKRRERKTATFWLILATKANDMIAFAKCRADALGKKIIRALFCSSLCRCYGARRYIEIKGTVRIIQWNLGNIYYHWCSLAYLPGLGTRPTTRSDIQSRLASRGIFFQTRDYAHSSLMPVGVRLSTHREVYTCPDTSLGRRCWMDSAIARRARQNETSGPYMLYPRPSLHLARGVGVSCL